MNKIRHDLSFTRQTIMNRHMYMCGKRESFSSLLVLPHEILIDHNVMIDVHLQDS